MTQNYFSYGYNMNRREMADRCPAATPVGAAVVDGWSFHINERGVATIEASPVGRVEGVLWTVTEACLRELDRFEGVAGGLYRRETVTVEIAGSKVEALVYVADCHRIGRPRAGYLEVVLEGAEDFGLSYDYREDLQILGWADPTPDDVRRAAHLAGNELRRLGEQLAAGRWEAAEPWTSRHLMISTEPISSPNHSYRPSLVTPCAAELSWLLGKVNEIFLAAPFYSRPTRDVTLDRLAATALAEASRLGSEAWQLVGLSILEEAIEVIREMEDGGFWAA